MAVLTLGQVVTLARGAGLPPDKAITAAAIAAAESGLRSDALGDTGITNATWGPSVGLWQVRSLRAEYGTGRSRDQARLSDPAFNARAMFDISSAGRNWSPWSVYNSGAYRAHLAAAAAAAGGTSSSTPPASPTMPATAVTSVSLGSNPFDVDVDLPGVLGPLEGPLEGLIKAVGPILVGGLFVAGGAALVVAGLWNAAGAPK